MKKLICWLDSNNAFQCREKNQVCRCKTSRDHRLDRTFQRIGSLWRQIFGIKAIFGSIGSRFDRHLCALLSQDTVMMMLLLRTDVADLSSLCGLTILFCAPACCVSLNREVTSACLKHLPNGTPVNSPQAQFRLVQWSWSSVILVNLKTVRKVLSTAQ